MSKFIKGQWEADQRIEGQNAWWEISAPVLNTRSGVVADTLNRDHVIDPDEDRANALLLAAAPDLLEACKRLADWVRRRCPADDWPSECDFAWRAIKKAETGTTPEF